MARIRVYARSFFKIAFLGLLVFEVIVNLPVEQRPLDRWRGITGSILNRLAENPDENSSRLANVAPGFEASSVTWLNPTPIPSLTPTPDLAEAEEAERDSVRFVLFTSWTNKTYKRVIHDNVLRTWPLTSPHIACLLFSEQEQELRIALSFGWYGLPLPKTACEGVPILREMFFVAMREFPKAQLFAFANGDLLFGADLGVTIQHVLRQPMVTTSPLLLLAHRDNLNFTGPQELNLTDVQLVPHLKLKAKKLLDGSSDIFMANRLFPWRHAPDIVVGRMSIGMSLVAMSQVLNVTIINLSKTVTVLHMTSIAGKKESKRNPTFLCNDKMFKRVGLIHRGYRRCPYIECASYRSVIHGRIGNNVTNVTLASVSVRSKLCPMCRFNLPALLKLNYTG